MKAPPTFSTGDPSYLVAASTPASSRPSISHGCERVRRLPCGACLGDIGEVFAVALPVFKLCW